jgi:2'-5' RNA ligase
MRLFVSLPMPKSSKKFLVEKQETLKNLDTQNVLMYPPVDTLHATLFYIGNVDENKVDAVKASLTDVARKYDKLELTLSGSFAFYSGNPKRPTVFISKIKDASNELFSLHHKVRDEMVSLGFRSNFFSFNPHVTLGKVPYGKRTIASYMYKLFEGFKEYESELNLSLTHIHLVESMDNDTGISEHRTVSKFELGKG